jgi:endonuclease G
MSLANIVPQDAKLNGSAWRRAENATRKHASRAPGPVYVFTGPFFGKRPAKIGPGQVWVPSHSWKLVYTPADKRAWAYWMTNDGAKQSLKPISCGELVRHTGLRLLPDSVHVES